MMSKKCPVDIGDHFYRNTQSVKIGASVPDLIEVKDITEKEGTFYIRGEYIYHTIGPTLERLFSDVIFKDPDWVVVKKGEVVNA